MTTLPPDEFRRLGHDAIDAIADRLAGLADAPVAVPAGRDEMEARLREPVPEHGSDPLAVLDVALRDVLSPGLRVDHPRFFGYVPLPGNPVGVVADALAAGFGTFAGTWLGSPGAAMVELVVLDWLRDLCGMPPSTEGLFVSGGSMANLTALAVALAERGPDDRARARFYVSDEAHSSVRRAARVLGVEARVLTADRDQRLIPRVVAATVAATGPPDTRRCASSRRPGRPAPPPSTRSSSCAACATAKGCGCTWTAPTALPRCCARPAARTWTVSGPPTR